MHRALEFGTCAKFFFFFFSRFSYFLSKISGNYRGIEETAAYTPVPQPAFFRRTSIQTMTVVICVFVCVCGCCLAARGLENYKNHYIKVHSKRMRATGFTFTVSVLIMLLYVRLPFQVLIIFWLGNYIKSKLNSFSFLFFFFILARAHRCFSFSFFFRPESTFRC